jgi:hypothetical protein
MDVMVYDYIKKRIFECEVKLSKADIRADLKKQKHTRYKAKQGNMPNQFYYCVPEELVEYTLGFIEKINENYGVIMIKHKLLKEDEIAQDCVVMKRAKPLIEEMCNCFKGSFFQRQKFEALNYRQELFTKRSKNQQEKLSKIKNGFDFKNCKGLKFGQKCLDFITPDDKRARDFTVLYKGKEIVCTGLLVPSIENEYAEGKEIVDRLVCVGWN